MAAARAILAGSRGHSEKLPASDSEKVPDTDSRPAPVSTEIHWRYWSGPIRTTPKHVSVNVASSAAVSARRRQTIIHTRTGRSSGFGASANAIPRGDAVPERVRATGRVVQRCSNEERCLAQEELVDDRREAESRDGDQHAVDWRPATRLQLHADHEDREANERHGDRRGGR